MQLTKKINKGIRFLICVINISSKYALVFPLKGKRGIIITNVFQKILDDSNGKPNEIWEDKSDKLYVTSMKS